MINPPKTIEEARAYRYGKWAGSPKGNAFREGYCAMEVCPPGRGAGWHQCARKATAGLFCKQHAPEAIQERQKASKDRWRRKMDRVLAPSQLIKKYRAALEKIAAGSVWNEIELARQIARDALKDSE